MRAKDARELFRQITKQYFAAATVTFSNQSRAAKPKLGLVVITPGSVKRPSLPNSQQTDGTMVSFYQSRMTITVDLFTHGSPVVNGSTGKTAAYENTAMDDMLSFADYLDSQFVTAWSHMNDVTVLLDGDVQDLTGAINDNNYEYRARATVMFYFTQRAIGAAGVAQERSIRYPVYKRDSDTGEIVRDEEGNPVIEHDPETGEPIYTEDPPVETESATEGYVTDAETVEKGATVVPVFTQTSTGGGTKELASIEGGYFTDVEIKEEK